MCAQETRIAKLLVSLKKRLGPFMAGEVEGFREVQVGVCVPTAGGRQHMFGCGIKLGEVVEDSSGRAQQS